MVYHFKIHRSKEGYWAECLELEGCQTQAQDRQELLSAISEALNLFLSEPESSKLIFPLPRRGLKGRNIVEVPVEPRVAFATLLRRSRLKEGLTQTEAAERMKLGGLYSYQKLESPHQSNPRLETLERVKSLFPKFPLEMVFL